MRITNNELRGTGVLETQRVRSMSIDISRNLRNYNCDKISIELSTIDAGSIILYVEENRRECLQRIYSVVYHHCGNYDFFIRHHCKYKELE